MLAITLAMLAATGCGGGTSSADKAKTGVQTPSPNQDAG